jgi:hypothetical protein
VPSDGSREELAATLALMAEHLEAIVLQVLGSC